MKNSSTFRGSVERGSTIKLEGEVLAHPSCTFAGRISVGAYSYFGRDCLISSSTIGRYCSFANSISVGLGEHPIDTLSTHPFFFSQRNGFSSFPGNIGIARDLSLQKYRYPQIGHDVWVGANVVIRRGISIGTGSVIGAGSVVTKDVPPYSIFGGVPAKLIRFRFPEETIQLLLAARWWDIELSYFTGLDVSHVESVCQKIINDRENGRVKDVNYETTLHQDT